MVDQPHYKFPKCSDCMFRAVICKDVNTADFNNLLSTTVQHHYKKGEIILKQGVRSHHLIFLTRGIVKFSFEDQNGRNLILTLARAETLLGLANILNEDVNVFSVWALEDCEGCMIDLNRLKLLALNNRSFMFNLLQMSTGMFRNSIFNFISLAHKQVIGRLADILIFLSKDIFRSNSFTLPLSRQEIAEYAGCSKEIVIHTLRNMDADGIIRANGKNIEILDFDKLNFISRVG